MASRLQRKLRRTSTCDEKGCYLGRCCRVERCDSSSGADGLGALLGQLQVPTRASLALEGRSIHVVL